MNDSVPNGFPRPLPEARAMDQEQWRAYCATLLAAYEHLTAEKEALWSQYVELVHRLPIPEEVKALVAKTYEELSSECAPTFSIEALIREVDKGGK